MASQANNIVLNVLNESAYSVYYWIYTKIQVSGHVFVLDIIASFFIPSVGDGLVQPEALNKKAIQIINRVRDKLTGEQNFGLQSQTTED